MNRGTVRAVRSSSKHSRPEAGSLCRRFLIKTWNRPGGLLAAAVLLFGSLMTLFPWPEQGRYSLVRVLVAVGLLVGSNVFFVFWWISIDGERRT